MAVMSTRPNGRPVVGKITAKAQTTVPQEIRNHLRVAAGDALSWEPGPDGTAIVRRVQPVDIEYLRALEATLSEWDSDSDNQAYNDL